MTLDEILSDPNCAPRPKHNDPFKHNCGMCSYFRSDPDDKHHGLCTICDMPMRLSDDEDDCREFSRD